MGEVGFEVKTGKTIDGMRTGWRHVEARVVASGNVGARLSPSLPAYQPFSTVA